MVIQRTGKISEAIMEDNMTKIYHKLEGIFMMHNMHHDVGSLTIRHQTVVLHLINPEKLNLMINL